MVFKLRLVTPHWLVLNCDDISLQVWHYTNELRTSNNFKEPLG